MFCVWIQLVFSCTYYSVLCITVASGDNMSNLFVLAPSFLLFFSCFYCSCDKVNTLPQVQFDCTKPMPEVNQCCYFYKYIFKCQWTLLKKSLLMLIDMFLLNDFVILFDKIQKNFPHWGVDGKSLHAGDSHIKIEEVRESGNWEWYKRWNVMPVAYI